MRMTTWYEKLGFIQNPFFLDPVPPDKDSMERGFVDRENEKASIESFVQLTRGKLIVFGKTGEGKSSLLNFVEYQAKQEKKFVIRVDGFKLTNKQAFVEELIHQVQLKTEEVSSATKKKLKERMEDLDIIELSAREIEKEKAGLEGKLTALVATITGKIEAEQEKGKERVYYVAPRIIKLERIVSELLPIIFDEMLTIVIADDLDKTQQTEFRAFLTEVAPLIPTNVLFVTTGGLAEVGSEMMKKCYEILDVCLLISPLDSIRTLGEFILGRMKAYGRKGYNLPDFDDGAIELLLDRASGNLRETFRYCYWALQKHKRSISEAMILEVIKEVDAPRFAAMGEADQRTLALLSEENEVTIKQMTRIFHETEGRVDPETVRLRLENLVNLGFALKRTIKKGRTYVSVYTVPKTIRSVLRQQNT